MKLRLAWSLVLVGCSGSSASEVMGPPPDSVVDRADAAATAPPTDPAAPTGSSSPDGGTPGPETCARPITFYRDADGDGFGAAAGSQIACTSPGAGWVAVPGDCHDGNALVFPGQKTYFGTGYPPASGGELSFDYDCSGSEEEENTFAGAGHFEGCNSMCKGASGYAPAPFRGAGTNPYCGSQTLSSCSSTSGTCKTISRGAGNPVACR